MNPFAWVALIISVLSTGVSIHQQRQARQEAKRARQVESALAREENRQRQLEQLRRARAARAEVVAGGEVAGVSGSSAIAGATGSIQSQLASNLSFLQSQTNLAGAAGMFRQRQANFESSAGTFGALSGLFLQAADSPTINTLFSNRGE